MEGEFRTSGKLYLRYLSWPKIRKQVIHLRRQPVKFVPDLIGAGFQICKLLDSASRYLGL